MATEQAIMGARRTQALVGIVTTSAEFGDQLAPLVYSKGCDVCVWPLDTRVVATILAAQPDLVILQVPTSLPLLERWRRNFDIGAIPVIPCLGVDDRLWVGALDSIRHGITRS
jgi:hypothetical protein